MEMRYSDEGGYMVLRAGGSIPDELICILRAMDQLVNKQEG